MNCIIIEWWKFNGNPTFWIEFAKDNKMSLHIGEDTVFITSKEE